MRGRRSSAPIISGTILEIQKYKCMMWFDSDARVGEEWDKDPMKVMVD